MPPSQRRRRRARNCGLDTGSLSLSEVVIVSSTVPQIKNICAFGLRGPSVAGLCSACSLSFSQPRLVFSGGGHHPPVRKACSFVHLLAKGTRV